MQPTKVLIVEDNVSILSMYEYKLRGRGYDVRSALNGKEGLDLAQSFVPSLILLDIRMPIMHGDEMLEQVHASSWGSSMSVIVLTNFSRSEAPMSLRVLGVDRYLVKAHYTPSQVVDVVAEVLARHS